MHFLSKTLLAFALLHSVLQGQICLLLQVFLGFPHSSVGNHLPAMQKTQVQFLGQEDALEKEMAAHSSILAWRISWKEEPGRLQSLELQESDTT